MTLAWRRKRDGTWTARAPDGSEVKVCPHDNEYGRAPKKASWTLTAPDCVVTHRGNRHSINAAKAEAERVYAAVLLTRAEPATLTIWFGELGKDSKAVLHEPSDHWRLEWDHRGGNIFEVRQDSRDHRLGSCTLLVGDAMLMATRTLVPSVELVPPEARPANAVKAPWRNWLGINLSPKDTTKPGDWVRVSDSDFAHLIKLASPVDWEVD